jgi:hypothetical protein
MPIAQQHVTTLRGWILLLRPEPQVVELFDAGIEANAPAVAVGERILFVAAPARVMQLGWN